MANNNTLQSTDFAFSIKRLYETNYFIQAATIPGISIADVAQPNRFGGSIYHHGDKLSHEEFSITFIVDEEMKNWMEIYGWLVGLAAPQKAKQYTDLATGPGVYSDATLILMSNIKNPLHQFTFHNMFPKSLSSIELDASQTDSVTRKATATFQFDYFTYQSLKKV